MPSYRTVLAVGLLRAGRAPAQVEAAARSVTRLDAFDIGIERGAARVACRFTADDDAQARTLDARLRTAVREVAEVPRARLEKIVKGRGQLLD